MKVLILSWNAGAGGRAKALLSLCQHLQKDGIEVVVGTGSSWSQAELIDHHGIPILCDWRQVNYRDSKADAVDDLLSDVNPDVVLAWDAILSKPLRNYNIPTVAYLRTTTVRGADEYWAPSKQCAQEHTESLVPYGEPECKPVYPTWYLDDWEDESDRPLDIVVHARKAGDLQGVIGNYNTVIAESFSYSDLAEYFRQSKIVLFPEKERFEPLGLFPIEGVANGCIPCITDNSGVAEIYPEYSFEKPREHIETLLEEAPSVPAVPDSPTDVCERLRKLA